jgi:hypothetical protein
MQGMTDGHKPVIGHHSQEHIIHISKNKKQRHLCHAAHIGYDSTLIFNAHNHLWDCGRYETYVSKGQVGEEEVHRGVEVGVRADNQDDKQVSKHCKQVHGQEQSKKEGLQFWIL